MILVPWLIEISQSKCKQSRRQTTCVAGFDEVAGHVVPSISHKVLQADFWHPCRHWIFILVALDEGIDVAHAG